MAKVSRDVFLLTVVVSSTATGVMATVLRGTFIPELMAVVSIPVVTVVPGLLTYLLITGSSEIDAQAILYSVGLSAMLLMALGFALTVVGWVIGIRPLQPLPAVVSFLLLILVLAFLIGRSGADLEIKYHRSIRVYMFVSLPVTAAIGSYIVRNNGPNFLIILTLFTALVLFVLVYFRPEYRFVAVYCVALALMIHNTFASEHLLWGDQEKEAKLVYSVLSTGILDFDSLPLPNKRIMLRIVVLHPLHSLLTGLGVTHVFKIIHPILLAVVPTAVYHWAAEQGRDRDAYLAAGSLIAFFPFITVLPRNTRTGVAIMFIVLLIHSVQNPSLDHRIRRALLVVFGTGVIVSHYGTAIMFMAIISGGAAAGALGRMDDFNGEDRIGSIKLPSVALLYIICFSWYIYISPDSATLRGLAGTIGLMITEAGQKLFQPSNSVTANYAVQSFSSTSLMLVKMTTILLFALIGIGWISVAIRHAVSDKRVKFDMTYMGLSAAAGALAVSTFLPLETFNTARTLAIVLAVVSPLLPVGTRTVTSVADRWTPQLGQAGSALAVLLIVTMFLASSGLLSATVTHEYSPNVLIDQERVIESGDPHTKSYLYKQINTDSEYRGSLWMDSHMSGEVYGSAWPGNPSRPPSAVNTAPSYVYNTSILSAGVHDCIYLGPFSTTGGLVHLPLSHFESVYMPSSKLNLMPHDKIYESGDVEVYC